jgi:hypothetical protein
MYHVKPQRSLVAALIHYVLLEALNSQGTKISSAIKITTVRTSSVVPIVVPLCLRWRRERLLKTRRSEETY